MATAFANPASPTSLVQRRALIAARSSKVFRTILRGLTQPTRVSTNVVLLFRRLLFRLPLPRRLHPSPSSAVRHQSHFQCPTAHALPRNLRNLIPGYQFHITLNSLVASASVHPPAWTSLQLSDLVHYSHHKTVMYKNTVWLKPMSGVLAIVVPCLHQGLANSPGLNLPTTLALMVLYLHPRRTR
jgi:hypothetical protein